MKEEMSQGLNIIYGDNLSKRKIYDCYMTSQKLYMYGESRMKKLLTEKNMRAMSLLLLKFDKK